MSVAFSLELPNQIGKGSNVETQSLSATGVFAMLLFAGANQIEGAILYVSQNSSAPAPPYAAWDTAAHTVQEAVDAASDGDTVLVAEGEYALTNQITIEKAIVLRSEMGAGQTSLDGQWLTRCLWISNSLAVVDGFTMTRGNERDGGDLAGGVFMVGGVLSNCIVKRPQSPFSEGRLVYCRNGGLITDCHIGENRAFAAKGAGVYLTDSELRNSTISGMLNPLAYGGANDGAGVYAISSTISGCTITGNSGRRAGGGAYLEGCVVDRCSIGGNRAGVYLMTAGLGGGIFATNSVIRNSLIATNVADAGYDPETDIDGGLPGFGGGIYLHGGSLLNCTVTGNRTVPPTGTEPAKGGGTYVETGNVRNSIIYFNSAPSGPNWHNVGGGSFDHSCTTPDPGGVGNLVEDPEFVDRTNGNYRLTPTSPCFDAGTNEAWMAVAADLDGNPRISHGTVDLGAWESTNTAPTIVNPPQGLRVRFTQSLANNGFLRSMIGGLPGRGTIIVETSKDLIEWQPIQTNTITGDSFELVEPISPSSPLQFFRALIRQ